MSRFDRVSAFEVASFKAVDDAKGGFEALVSVFGNVDRGGDRVMKGAFSKSLNGWQEKGDPIPVIWNHMWDNPEAHIGKVDPADAVETDDGLQVKGTIDLDNPFAKQVYRLLSERRVKEFSFGYDLKDSERKDGALNLLEIDLFEIGPTLKGMNPATELLAVKALAQATASNQVEITSIGDANATYVTGTTGTYTTTSGSLSWTPAVKAGARHSKETLAALQRMRAELDQLIAAGTPGDEPPKSDEAEAAGKASDPDEDIRTRISLLKEK